MMVEAGAVSGDLDSLRKLAGPPPLTVLGCLDALQRTATTPAKTAEPDSRERVDQDAQRPLRCRACGSIITTANEWISVDGRRVHRRTNPYGFEFEFGCFRTAPGARTEGKAISAYTWFPGFSWIVVLCGKCGAHLGWRFQSNDSSFFGLVLAALSALTGGENDGEPDPGSA